MVLCFCLLHVLAVPILRIDVVYNEELFFAQPERGQDDAPRSLRVLEHSPLKEYSLRSLDWSQVTIIEAMLRDTLGSELNKKRASIAMPEVATMLLIDAIVETGELSNKLLTG